MKAQLLTEYRLKRTGNQGLHLPLRGLLTCLTDTGQHAEHLLVQLKGFPQPGRLSAGSLALPADHRCLPGLGVSARASLADGQGQVCGHLRAPDDEHGTDTQQETGSERANASEDEMEHLNRLPPVPVGPHAVIGIFRWYSA